jgi:hypothetical protein
MSQLSRNKFLETLPDSVLPHLPDTLRNNIQVRQPWRWLVQFHFGEPRLHFEVSKASRRNGWELGFHCEARDKQLNRFLLDGFRRNLFEIKDTLGETMEAEMWDRGWTKIYEVVEERPLTTTYQLKIGQRLAEMIICIHPIFVELRGAVRRIHR